MSGHYICPNCGSVDLRVVVEVVRKLVQNGDHMETEDVNNCDEWTDDSTMLCNECEEVGPAHQFKELTQEESTCP